MEMGRKCAVPHCNTGYRNCNEKAALYRVPSDDFFLSKWQEAIARADRQITPNDYVCEKHFKDDDILRKRIIKDVVEEYQRPRLRPDAIPSIFPEFPEFILKMVKKRRKMPEEDPGIELSNQNENKLEENYIKSEPIEIIDNINLPETTVDNEIHIKSEPEEDNSYSTENESKTENDDGNIGPEMHCCNQCDYKTKYVHNLRTHETKHLTGEQYYIRCRYCSDFSSKWAATYRNHLKKVHGIDKRKVFQCSICKLRINSKQSLKTHMEGHKNSTIRRSPGFDFRKSDTEKSVSFKCTKCSYTIDSREKVVEHIKMTHKKGKDTIVFLAKDQPLVTCSQCSFMCNSQSSLARHTIQHRFPQCKDDYNSQSSLATPTIQHRVLECKDQCNSQSSSARPTIQHRVLECQDQCNSQSSLATPTNQGTVLECKDCFYSTDSQTAFDKHRMMECKKGFQCKNCEFKSDNRLNYLKHLFSHKYVHPKLANQGNCQTEVDIRGYTEAELLRYVDSEVVEVKDEPEFVSVKCENIDLE